MTTIYEAVQALCLSFPETEELVSHGFPRFKVAGKIFATYSVNHQGDNKVSLVNPTGRKSKAWYWRAIATSCLSACARHWAAECIPVSEPSSSVRYTNRTYHLCSAPSSKRTSELPECCLGKFKESNPINLSNN